MEFREELLGAVPSTIGLEWPISSQSETGRRSGAHRTGTCCWLRTWRTPLLMGLVVKLLEVVELLKVDFKEKLKW